MNKEKEYELVYMFHDIIIVKKKKKKETKEE